MANRWCDGFGRYGGTKSYMLNGSSSQAWAEVDAGFSLSSANPRTGTWHLRHDGDSQAGSTEHCRRVFGAQLTEVFVGYAVYAHALPSDDGDICLLDLRDQSNGTQISVFLGTDGSLIAYRGATVLGRTVPVIGAGAYQHIEYYAKAGNGTDGALEIRVDEVTRLNLTGIDTVSTANVEFSQMALRVPPDAFNVVQMDYADFYVNDTVDDGSGCDDFIGDCKSGTLMVNADTAQADWDLSTGVTGYELLDETPPNDADYIEEADSTGESRFGFQDGPANLTEILTVRPFDRAYKDDAGTCTLAPNIYSNATKGTVSGQPIATAASYYDSNVPLDPDTGAPWTASGLNAALRVVERTA